jgi:hypothetical protein
MMGLFCVCVFLSNLIRLRKRVKYFRRNGFDLNDRRIGKRWDESEGSIVISEKDSSSDAGQGGGDNHV